MYSDRYENYCRLKRTATFLSNGGNVTEDWVEEHKLHILKYSEIFSNISKVNEEITDATFRNIAKESATLLENLLQSLKTRNTFNIKFYMMLNQHMAKLCEYIFTEDELEFCMSKMSI